MSRRGTSTPWVARLEGLSLAGMALGVAAMLQPWWDGGMRAGFFVAAACTIAQIVFSHMPQRSGPAA